MSLFTRRGELKAENKAAARDISAGSPRAAERGHRVLRDTVVFAMFGAMMFVSKAGFEIIPNFHLLGMFTILLTVVYRTRALIPIYIYVMLNGFYAGFSIWWIPYLYIWTVLWGVTMLLPRHMPDIVAAFVYPLVCGLHGLAFGTLYAPAQALLYGFSFQQTVAWIAAGLPYDLIHCAGNTAAGLLVLPLSKLLRKLDARI